MNLSETVPLRMVGTEFSYCHNWHSWGTDEHQTEHQVVGVQKDAPNVRWSGCREHARCLHKLSGK